MTEPLHPAASHHLPSFITAPGETDVLMVVMAVILVVAVLGFGISVPSVAHAARAHGAQVPQAAVRDRCRSGSSRALHPHAYFLGCRPAACADRYSRFRRLAQQDRRIGREDRRARGRAKALWTMPDEQADEAPTASRRPQRRRAATTSPELAPASTRS